MPRGLRSSRPNRTSCNGLIMITTEKIITILVCVFVVALFLSAITAHAEDVPQGCFRSTDNLWSCWSPSDGQVNFPDMGSAVLNSIHYGTTIGALVEGKRYAERLAGSWRDLALAQTENSINLEYHIDVLKRKLKRSQRLARRRCL